MTLHLFAVLIAMVAASGHLCAQMVIIAPSGGACNVFVGDTVNFSASQNFSSTDIANRYGQYGYYYPGIKGYGWSFGDGSTLMPDFRVSQGTNGPWYPSSISHTFSSPGTYTVSCSSYTLVTPYYNVPLQTIGVGNASVTIYVWPKVSPTISSISAWPPVVASGGKGSNISVSTATSYVTQYSITPSSTTMSGPNVTVYPAATQSYAVTVSNPYGSSTKNITVNVIPFRKTVLTLSKNTQLDGSGGLYGCPGDYAYQVAIRFVNRGWNLIRNAENPSISDAEGIVLYQTSAVGSGGVDFAFYSGHGNLNGPVALSPNCVPSNYFWSNGQKLNPSGRGLRWFASQSCEWLQSGANGASNNFSNDYYSLNRWRQAMGNANGSMHAILGYASQSWTCIRGGNDNPTDLAPVAAIANSLDQKAGIGDSWILGSYTQYKYFTGDKGEVPAVLSVVNSRGEDYYYESLAVPWCDPVDVSDSGTNTINYHFQSVGSPQY